MQKEKETNKELIKFNRGRDINRLKEKLKLDHQPKDLKAEAGVYND